MGVPSYCKCNTYGPRAFHPSHFKIQILPLFVQFLIRNSAWIILHLMAKMLMLKILLEAQKLESSGLGNVIHCLKAGQCRVETSAGSSV